jgi:hypothetical protein
VSDHSARAHREGDRGELELRTGLIRHFLNIAPNEPVELTAFVQGRIQVAQVDTVEEHHRRLHDIQRREDFNGAYLPLNGPFNPALLARYSRNQWHRAWNGRVSDADILFRRAVFIDCDPVRPKGISATQGEHDAAQGVASTVCEWLASRIGGSSPIGAGSSGNGAFILIAIEPTSPTKETTQRIGKFLSLLQKKFGNDIVKIDSSVSNPARLMPAPGTWKRKGVDTPDRPHRMVTFTCKPTVTRVPLEVLC